MICTLNYLLVSSWQQYLEEMSKSGTYGDEITLRGIANMFNVEIIVKPTLGQGGRVIISPEDSIIHSFLVVLPKNMDTTMLFYKEMDIGLLKTLMLLILIQQTVNLILILEMLILMRLISNTNTLPIPSLILTKNLIWISKTILLCLISHLTQLMNRHLILVSSLWRRKSVTAHYIYFQWRYWTK